MYLPFIAEARSTNFPNSIQYETKLLYKSWNLHLKLHQRDITNQNVMIIDIHQCVYDIKGMLKLLKAYFSYSCNKNLFDGISEGAW